VFIGGNFASVFLGAVAQPRSRVALLNADGTLDTAWDPGAGIGGGSQIVYDLALSTGGTLYIGGNFTTYDSQTRQYLAAVNAVGVTAQVVALSASGPAIAGQPLTLGTAAVGAAFPSAPYLTYQWIKDGSDIPGATGQTHYIASYSAADAGSYTVRVNGAGGSTTSSALSIAAAPAGFASWAAALPAGQRGPNDDPDRDGVPNLMEYALNLDPAANSAGQLPREDRTGTHITLTYRRHRADIIYSVEAGDDLALPWSTANVNQGTPAGDGTTTASLPFTAPEDFLRLRVTLAP
jgi:hypothetical protein